MKTVASSISAYLAAYPTQFLIADAYVFTLQNGTVLRYTNAQADFTLGANTYSASGPTLERSSVRQVVGVQVDTLDLIVSAPPTLLVSGVPFLQALRSGLFDGAGVTLYRIFFSAPGVLVNSTGTGDLILFSGRVADMEVGRFVATVRVNSDLELLNVKLPRNMYQPGCLNTVYDSGCALVKATWAVTGTTQPSSTSSTILATLAQAAGYFDQGIITYTSGVNSGLSRTIRKHTTGTLVLISPFPNAPGASDTFTLRPGCDKTQTTCASKFNNVANFRGHPYIPLVTSVVNVG